MDGLYRLALPSVVRAGDSRIGTVPRAVLLDLDDTLCDYSSARDLRLRIAFTRALATRSTPTAAVDIERLLKDSIQAQPHGTDHFAKLLTPYGVTEIAAKEAAEWFKQNRFHGLRLFPETISVLQLLRNTFAGDRAREIARIGIVTNGPTEVQRAKLDHLGLQAFTDFIIISEEFGVAKPHPAIFQEALRRADVAAEDAIVVGDSPEFDIAGAHGAGIRAIWVNRHGLTWQRSGEKPAAEIESLAALAGLIGAISGRDA